MTPWREADERILILGFRSISFLIRDSFSTIVVRFSKVANFSFTKVILKNNIEFNFKKVIPQNVINFRKRLSSLIFAKVISQDVVKHIFTRFVP